MLEHKCFFIYPDVEKTSSVGRNLTDANLRVINDVMSISKLSFDIFVKYLYLL